MKKLIVLALLTLNALLTISFGLGRTSTQFPADPDPMIEWNSRHPSKALKRLSRAMSADPLLTASSSNTIPPEVPYLVSIDSLGSKWGGHQFHIDPHSGNYTFTAKNGDTFSGTAAVVYIGPSSDYTWTFINKNEAAVFAFSDRVGTTVIYGYLGACTQTGQVAVGYPGSAYNIASELVRQQCAVPPPPPPPLTYQCVASGSSVLRYDSFSRFTLTIPGLSPVGGTLSTLFSDANGTLVLRSASADNDVTLVVSDGLAIVTLRRHNQRVASFTGSNVPCN